MNRCERENLCHKTVDDCCSLQRTKYEGNGSSDKINVRRSFLWGADHRVGCNVKDD